MIPFSRNSSSATERLHPGRISYLKKRAECNEEELLAANVSDGCFDHLVLILSTDDHKAQVEALILTSFGGKTLEERHPHNRRVRLSHLPIAPAPRHPDIGILLELEGDLRLRKETYVNTEVSYMIPWSMLRATHRDLRSGKILELKPHSFAQLLHYVDARVSNETLLLRNRITSSNLRGRGFHGAETGEALDLASTPWGMLLVFLIMVVIYAPLAYLQSFLDKIKNRAIEITMGYLGSWPPFRV